MKVSEYCIPCFLNQCINAMEKSGVPKEKRRGILAELAPIIADMDMDATPAHNSTVILHKLVALLGGSDPFLNAKKESNRQALMYLAKLKEILKSSKDPLKMAIKFSVAGNVVDLGIYDTYDLAEAIENVIKTDFKRDDYEQFKNMLNKARKIMIIGDNSGEIVFDRLLVEQLQKFDKSVVYGVKGDFVLNDATLKDAQEAGMDKICKVISNGNNYLGTIPEICSPQFISEFDTSDIVISKGQANYESLEGTEFAAEKTFFLLKAKCPVVAKNLDVDYGDIVFVKNNV